jgi:mono/diheme cytochrome c family protein
MKRIAAALAAVLTVAIATPASAADAKTLFKQKCAACHGPDGKGQTKMGEKLGVKDLTTIKDSEADIEAIISAGKPPKMTAFKDKISADEIKALAAFVKGGLK